MSVIDDVVTALTTNFQIKLVSSQNIKTINNESLLGSGNIDVTGEEKLHVHIDGKTLVFDKGAYVDGKTVVLM